VGMGSPGMAVLLKVWPSETEKVKASLAKGSVKGTAIWERRKQRAGRRAVPAVCPAFI
jgi:hypothetical protein